MTPAQQICLFFMFIIGGTGLVFAADSDTPRYKRPLLIAWTIFWLGPPLYFIWTKGVMG
jgi:hypothetical protein